MLMKAANAFETKSPSTQAMKGPRVYGEMQEWSPLFCQIPYLFHSNPSQFPQNGISSI